MGRWFVVLLAVALTVGVLFAFFPTLRTAEFNVGEHGVKWFIPLGLGIAVAYHKLTGK